MAIQVKGSSDFISAYSARLISICEKYSWKLTISSPQNAAPKAQRHVTSVRIDSGARIRTRHPSRIGLRAIEPRISSGEATGRLFQGTTLADCQLDSSDVPYVVQCQA